MECSKPGAIRDEELVAYLVGENVRPAVIEHLQCCESCSSQLATYRRIEHKLTSKLYRWDCPPSQVLGEYQLGMLDSESALEVEQHLRTCVLCAADLTTLTAFLTNDPMLMEPISAVQASVSASQNNHHPVQEAKQALEYLRDQAVVNVRKIIATLLPPQPRLAFQRDLAQQGALWPRHYSAEDVNVSLHVERSSGRRGSLQLIGFVTRQGATLETLQGIPVQLSSQTGAVSLEAIDELGNFVFSSLAPATYILELQFPEVTIVIDELAVTAQD